MHLDTYGEYALELANTWDPSLDHPERLPDVEALEQWLRDVIGIEREVDDHDLAVLKATREELRRVLTAADNHEAVTRLNRLMREYPIRPVISGHDDQDWHLHLADGASGGEIAAAAVFGLSVMLLDHGFDRRGVCAADDCEDVFVDTSRNRSRRYCSSTCSSRANVAAYRARRRADA